MLGATHTSAQQKYWLDFDPITTDVSAEDFSLDSLKIESKSVWFNAVTTRLTPTQRMALNQNKKIIKMSPVLGLEVTRQNDQLAGQYGDYISCLNPEYLDELGLDGHGVIAGVIDAGFINVDSGAAFQHMVQENRILGYKDFIDEDTDDFFEQKTSGDIHGANVLAYFGGYNAETESRIGLGSGASFYLARTENGDKEHLVEEDDWIEAIEWMHTKGVRVVNTSLGYSTFDDAAENHANTEMNGKTTRISKAAQRAVEKGMVLVCSAGNLGHKDWKYVSAPADAEGVISVGATTKVDFARAYYSSIGPEYNDYLKPDISCYSDRGTSYASPEIAGLVACMLQKYPTLTPKEVKEALAISGHLNPLPNNYIGYGVPDPVKLFDYLAGKQIEPNEVEQASPRGDAFKIKVNKKLKKSVIAFHKTDPVHTESQLQISNQRIEAKYLKKILSKQVADVNYRSKVRKNGATIVLYRPKNRDIKFTTVVLDGKLIEIEWK